MKRINILYFCLLCSISVKAQSWLTNADTLIIKDIYAERFDEVDIYSFPGILTRTDTIAICGKTALHIPFDSCRGYFIDFQPYTNWAHRCEYCFIDAFNNHIVVSSEMPPEGNSLAPMQITQFMPNPSVVTADTSFDGNIFESDSEHLWAVLIYGEEISNIRDMDIPPQHWFDLSCVYTVLANVYGYKQKIKHSDTVQYGHIVVSAPNGIRKQYSNPDLNGDSITFINMYIDGDFFNEDDDEGYTKHTKTNLENIFKCFAGNEQMVERYTDFGLRELTEEDQLFIFVTGHGQYDSLGNIASFMIKEGDGYPSERVTDEEFVGWLRGIKCSQMTLFMENCHS